MKKIECRQLRIKFISKKIEILTILNAIQRLKKQLWWMKSTRLNCKNNIFDRSVAEVHCLYLQIDMPQVAKLRILMSIRTLRKKINRLSTRNSMMMMIMPKIIMDMNKTQIDLSL